MRTAAKLGIAFWDYLGGSFLGHAIHIPVRCKLEPVGAFFERGNTVSAQWLARCRRWLLCIRPRQSLRRKSKAKNSKNESNNALRGIHGFVPGTKLRLNAIHFFTHYTRDVQPLGGTRVETGTERKRKIDASACPAIGRYFNRFVSDVEGEAFFIGQVTFKDRNLHRDAPSCRSLDCS
jgi:hypothetical protein